MFASLVFSCKSRVLENQGQKVVLLTNVNHFGLAKAHKRGDFP